MALAGWLPFPIEVYHVWQYTLIVNMLLVMGIAVHQIRRQQKEVRERAQLARELQVEREAAFHQRQFMGMVAHEFRTPLAVIAASLENLRSIGFDDMNLARRHDRIGRATERLVQLTDNCLADARISADSLILMKQSTDLRPIISSAVAMVQFSDNHRWRLLEDEALVESTVTLEAKSSPRITADPALLRIAVSNVIDNAVKYSEGGLIEVRLKRALHAWTISIQDQGRGISTDRVEIIFERYRRVESSNASVSGFGLGLFVSRQIARAHGGELALVSNSPNGCRFEFTLPCHPLES
ncbi:hypothetical protein GCM10009038_13340 [Salinicola rhizosphaerae]|uniref:histidine kinase n=1 Tax=Salinicola rhizosphaerae TaxID=1443141 RepID=A0ABQ3DUT7_9GAMM|nr:hypothetical protein GCM10009038_13340 [Salinicola rhizosphaerae]